MMDSLLLIANGSGAAQWLGGFASPESFDRALDILRAIAIGLLGGLLLGIVVRNIERGLSRRLTPQQTMLLTKTLKWGGWFLIFVTVISQLGFKLGAVLGAAGILGVAIGFAAQTSASNLISGIFLIFERPFQVGDLITVSGNTGIVSSIDLLSIKIRKFDNGMIRVPNETIIKSEVTNITQFPLRRVDIEVGIAYKEDFERAKEILLDVANKHPKCLTHPEPLVLFKGFGASSQDILFGVWAMKTDFLEVRNGITYGVKKAFDEHGIEIPFPHLSVYTGEATREFPVTLRQRGGEEAPPPGAPPAD